MCCEEKHQINHRIASFVLLVGVFVATITTGILAQSTDNNVYTSTTLWLPFWVCIVSLYWCLVYILQSFEIINLRDGVLCSQTIATYYWYFCIGSTLLCSVINAICYIMLKEISALPVALIILPCVFLLKQTRESEGDERSKFRLLTFFMAVLGFVTLMLPIALTYNAVSRAMVSSMAPMDGNLYTVGNSNVYISLNCVGPAANGLTILLEPGLDEATRPFFESVITPMTSLARVCYYDRPGYGYSSSGAGNAVASVLASYLKQALDAANEAGPFIIVTHSIGGLYGVNFALKYPSLVKGMVLLDSTSYNTFTDSAAALGMSAQQYQAMGAGSNGMFAMFSPLGFEFIAAGVLAAPYIVKDASGKDLPLNMAHFGSSLNNRQFLAAYRELAASLASGSEVQALIQAGGAAPLKNIPIAVIAAGINYNSTCEYANTVFNVNSVYLSCNGYQNQQAYWRTEQAALKSLSSFPSNTLDVVINSPHNVLVFSAGRDLVMQRLQQVIAYAKAQ